MTAPLLCAVDVDAGSARAGITDRAGRRLGRTTHPIAIRHPSSAMAEHKLGDIWTVISASVRGALTASGARPSAVVALGFGATCSLVALNAAPAPVAIGEGWGDGWDTIAWCDQRAMGKARDAGAAVSPEMQAPKRMWIKRHLPHVWARMMHLFDLADYLPWRATGTDRRSTRTMTGKWGWDDGAPPEGQLRALGLADLSGRAGLPNGVVPGGAAAGRLSAETPEAFGLTEGCLVATGMIDASAGALGGLGARLRRRWPTAPR